jgi:hypothetical protein
VLLVALARRGRALPLMSLLWLVPFAGLGAWAVRGLAWWPIVAAVTVARVTAESPGSPSSPRPERRGTATMRRLNVAVAALLVIAGVALLPVWRAEDPALRAPVGVLGTAPPGITAALRDLVAPSDRLFAPQPWGSWFEFALPETTVFIDSRIELFAPAVWDDYDAITDGRADWQARLEQWNVTIVVAVDGLGPLPLADRVAGDPGWRQAYEDEDGRIFVRSDRPG